ncbi:hypothetical protein AQUCO_01400178v1 [Aquilegia coerulea]|uniref:Uncharacterized protein n=1 Tax=Aquilegia coerulea TaxID=218851 RepID=A0A2G5DUZ5_AQUCA|nr:hypothetical protein AQUCO_01400178v1 [Aquilegia coerulea]
MDAQKSQTKLTRTNSSLLRSSPTIRSSIHSISEIYKEEDEEAASEEEKPHKSGSIVRTRSNGFNRFLPIVAIFIITPSFFFFYLGREEIPTSGNLLLALIFIGFAIFIAKKKRGFVIKNSSFIKQLWYERNRRVGLSKSGGESVQWFIGNGGNSSSFKKDRKEEKIIKEGVEFYSNGDFYEGEFHKGRSNGSGVYNYFVNGRYEGDWIDGRYDGYGIESWARGSRYRGQYRQGLRHGCGVYRFYTGDSYSGEWCNGQSHGIGVQTCADGSCYVGEFKCGVKHGLGCYHFRNGDRYAGEYFGDKIHGFGVYHFANGHRYEGSWHEGRKQGFGNYTFRNGETKCGEWDCGVLKNSQPQVNDAVMRAVQAARKAAENAIRIPRLDEQVNKVVMAANRAATAARVAAVKAVQNRIDGKFCDIDV